MGTVAGFPYWEIPFTKDGEPDGAAQTQLEAGLTAQHPTDLFVISHGWRNTVEDARALYGALLGNMRTRLEAGHPANGEGRHFAVVGVLWPAMRFAEDDELPHAKPAGGGAAMGGPSDAPSGPLAQKMRELAQALGAQHHPQLARATEALDRLGQGNLPDGSDPEEVFIQSLRELLPRPSDSSDDASDRLFNTPSDRLFENLKQPLNIVSKRAGAGGVAAIDPPGGKAPRDPQGGAAGLGSMFDGVRAAAWRILNYATYYVMKERAGKVGLGLNAVLADVRNRQPNLRIQLIGHSFGARLVTAAAAGPNAFAPSSMSLLQGAYSHNALGPGSALDHIPVGFFRALMTGERVNGPIIATYTQNDKAVGIAYAIASRLSGDRSADFGGPNDVFGGIGRSGAVRMAPGETVAATLENGNFDYPQWAAGKVTNLLADQFIFSHGDVTNSAVANAVLNAARS